MNQGVLQLKSPLLYTLCFMVLCCAGVANGQASSGAACLRVVRNQLGGNSGNWGQAGAPVVFGSGGTVSSFTGVGPATFTLEGSSAGYSFLGVQLNLTKNARYALRVTVSNYTGNYYGTNFEILGASAGSFSGITRLNFTGNGVYALVFTYLGADALYQARVGIDADAGPSSAGGPGGFTVSDLSLELLPGSTVAPGEYVTPGYAWGFNYPSLNTYDPTTGRLSEAAGTHCATTYRNVWAVTADSFGDNTYSFPNQLANNLAQGFVFFVDSVAGRRLAVAQENIAALMSNTAVVQTDTLLPSTALPSTAATPNGLIVEGGINDIIQGSNAVQIEAVVDLILNSLARPRQSAILITLSPFGNNANWTAAREQVRLAYNQWLRTQDSPQNGIFVYDMAANESAGGLANDANPTLLAADVDSGDGLHPNLAGGVRIASRLNQILNGIDTTPATDGPMPLWALAALAAGCMGIASRRLARRRTLGAAQE